MGTEGLKVQACWKVAVKLKVAVQLHVKVEEYQDCLLWRNEDD